VDERALWAAYYLARLETAGVDLAAAEDRLARLSGCDGMPDVARDQAARRCRQRRCRLNELRRLAELVATMPLERLTISVGA